MVVSQSLQGRQSLQVRSRPSIQFAAAAHRRSDIHSASGTADRPLPCCSVKVFCPIKVLTLFRFTAVVENRLCYPQKRASGCRVDRTAVMSRKRQQPPQSAAERLTSLRCSSGENVSTSDSQNEPDETKHAHERNTSWTRMVLALPLELAAVSSRTDNFYLRKRKRKQWWSVGHFPKVQLCVCSSHASTLYVQFCHGQRCFNHA